jgi:NADH dehydrogenase FAD-containing subunit
LTWQNQKEAQARRRFIRLETARGPSDDPELGPIAIVGACSGVESFGEIRNVAGAPD